MTLYIYAPDLELRRELIHYNETRRITDSGFDLPCLESVLNFQQGYLAAEIKTGVHCAAVDQRGNGIPFLILARSSTSKTPLRMSNQIGLADLGYRGEVFVRVDCMNQNLQEYSIEFGRRLFQIVAPNWLPWSKVIIVNELNELPAAVNNRGHGGYGSTGQ